MTPRRWVPKRTVRGGYEGRRVEGIPLALLGYKEWKSSSSSVRGSAALEERREENKRDLYACWHWHGAAKRQAKKKLTAEQRGTTVGDCLRLSATGAGRELATQYVRKGRPCWTKEPVVNIYADVGSAVLDTRWAISRGTSNSRTKFTSPNYVDTFGLDFAFSFANILSLIAFIISYCLFADELVYALNWWWNIQQSLLDGATVVLIIILVDKTQLSLILEDVAAWPVYVTIGNLTTISACTVEHCCSLSNTALENAAKSGILLACADGRIRQCYLTICAILADYEEQVLLTSVKKNRYCTRCTVAPDDREDLCGSYLWRIEQFTRLQQERCLDKGHDDFVHLVDCFRWKHYNFNIHVSLATDTLHLLLKGLVMKMLDFMQDMLDDIYPSSRKTWDNSTTLVTQESGKQKAIIQQLVAVVSLLFVSKAPFALHFIRAVCDLHALTYIIQDIRMYGALDGICTRANSEAYYITIVKQFYSMTNKKDEVAANIAISDFTHAAAVFIYPSIKCWRSSGKRHNDSEHCDEEVVRCAPNWQQIGLWRRDYVWLYLILIIIDYTCYDKDGKHMAYIGVFSKTLQAFKFYDLSTIICLVHLVLRDLPDLTTRTTMSYYVNNYIDWDEYNRLYSLTFDINLLRTLREY
ncbi:hypothetical protein HBI27_173050 [Parastagonospora nodorum]|nr:hypothetical protein HBI27_173050 [Parastagonospora nodorum]